MRAMLRAVLWDVDGTLAETERDGHRVAFDRAFEAAGLPWRSDVDTYGRLLEVAGGYERLLHDMASRPDAPRDPVECEALARCLHRTKNEAYAELVAAGGTALRPGVRRVIDACRDADIAQAIVTTTSRVNVDALLSRAIGVDWSARFAAMVCAEDAPAKKPDPLAYEVALERLALDAREAVAIEDSPNGLAAARACDIAVLVTRSVYFRDADIAGAAAACDDLDSVVRGTFGTARRIDVATLEAIAFAAASWPTRPSPRTPAR